MTQTAIMKPIGLVGMTALSIRQPWTHAILHMGKDIENRTWSTRFRGQLVVHAGKSIDAHALAAMRGAGGRELGQPPTGALLGVVQLVDVHHAEQCRTRCSPWSEPATFHWQLANPRQFATPITMPGRLGLWKIPA